MHNPTEVRDPGRMNVTGLLTGGSSGDFAGDKTLGPMEAKWVWTHEDHDNFERGELDLEVTVPFGVLGGTLIITVPAEATAEIVRFISAPGIQVGDALVDLTTHELVYARETHNDGVVLVGNARGQRRVSAGHLTRPRWISGAEAGA